MLREQWEQPVVKKADEEATRNRVTAANEKLAEEKKKREEVLHRAEELREKFKAMMERNSGEYPPTGTDLVSNTELKEDINVMSELENFFEKDCANIPLIEGGNGDRDRNFRIRKLKKIADDLWVLRESRNEYNEIVDEYFVVDKEKAIKLIEDGIKERKQQIKDMEDKNRAAQEALE